MKWVLPIVNIQKNPTQIAECTEVAAMLSKGYIVQKTKVTSLCKVVEWVPNRHPSIIVCNRSWVYTWLVAESAPSFTCSYMMKDLVFVWSSVAMPLLLNI